MTLGTLGLGTRMALGRRVTLVALVGLFAGIGVAAPLFLVLTADRGQAGFADAEGLGLMRLSAAKVDIVAGERGAAITAPNLAPGDRVTGSIDVRNAGTVPLHWTLLADRTADPLAEWLRWDLWRATTPQECGSGSGVDPADVIGRGVDLSGPGTRVVLAGDPRPGVDPGDRLMTVGAAEVVCLGVELALEAPDSVQRRTIRQSFVFSGESTAGSTR
jgi:hypothetical protein